MPQVSRSQPSEQLQSAVVLFGLSDEGKPQAGLFRVSQSALARKAAKQLRLTFLNLSNTDLAAIGKIPPGRLYHNRRSVIPNIRKDVHQKLLELAKNTGASGATASSMPPAAGFPKNWDSIGPGHQVIAQCSLADGWWEAIVISRKDDMLTLRWRDYPREASFNVHFAQVALQQPQSAN